MFAMLLMLATEPTAHAYDRDFHYFWTYYLALQVGLTDRQAYQIASATQAIDDDPNTDPLTLAATPHDGGASWLTGENDSFRNLTPITGPEGFHGSQRMGDIWRDFHCFAEHKLQSKYRKEAAGEQVAWGGWELAGWVPPSDLEGPVQEARDRRGEALRIRAFEQGNPGPYLHYLQDCYAHRDFNDIRGHASAGHLPDWPATNPLRAYAATEDTVETLQRFMREVLGQKPLTPDPRHLRDGLRRLMAVNSASKLSIDNPGELFLDEANEWTGAWTNFGGTAVATIAGQPGLDPGEPNIAAAAAVVVDLVREDREAKRLPGPLPGTELRDGERSVPPRWWMKYDYDDNARAIEPAVDPSAEAVPSAFAVEKTAFELLPDSALHPRLVITADRESERLWRVEPSITYALSGLAPLPELAFPVDSTCRWSTGGDTFDPPWRDGANGTTRVSGLRFLTYEDIWAGLSWRCTLYVYGQDPIEVDVPITWDGPPPALEEIGDDVDPALESMMRGLQSYRDQALGNAASIRAACAEVAATREAADAVVTPFLREVGPLGRDIDGLERTAAALPGADGRAAALADGAYAAGVRAAEAAGVADAESTRTCELADEILATPDDVALLERLGADAKIAWDRAAAASRTCAAERDAAAAAAEEAKRLNDQAMLFDVTLDVTASDLSEAIPDLARYLEALRNAPLSLEAVRPLPPVIAGLEGRAAGELAYAEQQLADGTIAKTGPNKAALKEAKSIYRDVATLARDASACIDREATQLGALSGKADEAVSTAETYAARVEVLQPKRPPSQVIDLLAVLAADTVASAEAADLFPAGAEQAVADAKACLGVGKTTVNDRTSPDAQVARADCSMFWNAEARWDRRRDAPACFCKNGYTWNATGTGCDPIPPPGGDPNDPYRASCQQSASTVQMLAASGDPTLQQMAWQTADLAIAQGCAPDLIRGGGMATGPSGPTGPTVPTGSTSSGGTGSGCAWDDTILGQDWSHIMCRCSDGTVPPAGQEEAYCGPYPQ